MAKRRRGKRRRGFVAIPFSGDITLATLANSGVIMEDLLGSQLSEDLFCISVDICWAIKDLTAGEGPIDVGLCHNDLSVSEVAECLDVDLSDPDAIIERERARRPVRRSGKFSGVATEQTLNDGKEIRTKMKFTVGNGHCPAAWARNRSGAALTTGAIISYDGTLYGRWLR